VISVSARPLPASAGIPGGGAVAVFHDVTEQRSLQAALKGQYDRHDRLLGVLSDLGEGVAVVENGRFVFVNDAYAAITGRTAAELLMTTTDALAPDDDARADFARARAELTGDAAALRLMQTRLRHRDGHDVPVETTGMSGTHDGRTQWVYIVRDISDRRRYQRDLAERAAALELANRELETARDLADAASEAKSRFVATISHEIRTPLNGVIGLNALLLDTDLTDQQRDLADTARRSGELLLSLVDDVLDFSKIEAGKLEITHADVDTDRLVHDVAGLFADQAGRKGLDLRVSVAPDCPATVRTDATRVRQILTNLLGNAVKFTERGHITLAAVVAADGVRVAVTDTGIGITADAQRRLFRPFEQADSSTTRRFGGTGLGLAISHQLAELVGGALTATSKPGQGSTFTVTLPLAGASAETVGVRLRAAVDPAPDRAVVVPRPSARTSLRVLVAEDDEVNRRVVLAMLAKLGHHADVVGNGREAVDAERLISYDVVLMDCRMPEMNGYEAAVELRATPATATLPIVALTAGATTEDRGACAAAGMDDYLTKPVRLHELDSVLSRVTR
jgi:PAS domain S-box-containing protein